MTGEELKDYNDISDRMHQYREFLNKLTDRIGNWHSECDCYACSDMSKAIVEIEEIITKHL